MQNKKVHPNLTKEEKSLVENFFYLPGWQFDEIIKPNCTEMTKYNILWEENNWEYAIIYGLNAMKSDTKESCIANYFVRYKYKLYQANCIEKIISIVNAIKKEEEVSKYWRKYHKKRRDEIAKIRKQKLELKIQKNKALIKKVA